MGLGPAPARDRVLGRCRRAYSIVACMRRRGSSAVQLARRRPRPRGRPRLTTWRGALAAYSLDAPGVRDRLAGFQGEQVGAGDEGVRRAGHRLDGYGAAPVSAVERVPGEGLEPA